MKQQRHGYNADRGGADFSRDKSGRRKKKKREKKKEKRKKRRRTNSWKMAEEGRGEGKEVKKKREGNFSIDDQ